MGKRALATVIISILRQLLVEGSFRIFQDWLR